jgi:hypothetical protein
MSSPGRSTPRPLRNKALKPLLNKTMKPLPKPKPKKTPLKWSKKTQASLHLAALTPRKCPHIRRNNHRKFHNWSLNQDHKARFVAGGHQTDPLKESVYSSVVSRDSVHLAFLIAALNDLEILSADIQNAYLNAPTKERIYTTACPDIGTPRDRTRWNLRHSVLSLCHCRRQCS